MAAQFNYFGATAAEVLHEFKGAAYTDFETSPGAGDGEAEVGSALDRAEDVLLAYLPPRYRRVLTRVEGEIVEESADEGQTDVTLSLAVASEPELRVWKNWPHRGRPPESSYELAATEWGRSGQTVTLARALSAGDSVIAAYYVEKSSWEIPLLARAVVAVAAFSLADRVFGGDDPGWRDARRAFDSALELLRDLRDGGAGVPEIEDLRMNAGSGERAAGEGSSRALGRA